MPNVKVTLAVAVALCGLAFRWTADADAEDQEHFSQTDTLSVEIIPRLPDTVLSIRCSPGFPPAAVHDIIARTLSTGKVFAQPARDWPRTQESRALHLDVEGTDRSYICRCWEDAKILAYFGDAMVRRPAGQGKAGDEVMAKMPIRYEMDASDHAQLLELVRATRAIGAKEDGPLGWRGIPQRPAVIVAHPLFPAEGVTSVRFYDMIGELALPSVLTCEILARTIGEGDFVVRPMKGSIFGWFRVDTTAGDFGYRLFKTPKTLQCDRDGVVLEFHMDDADHARLVELVEAARRDAGRG